MAALSEEKEKPGKSLWRRGHLKRDQNKVKSDADFWSNSVPGGGEGNCEAPEEERIFSIWKPSTRPAWVKQGGGESDERQYQRNHWGAGLWRLYLPW